MEKIKDNTSHNHNDKQATQELQGTKISELDSLKNYEEKYVRLSADFANYKKRVETEWAKLQERAEDNILKSMLPIFDDFIRLNNHVIRDEYLAKGVQAVQKKWQKWLESKEVELINPEGEEFDHHLHDAVMPRSVDDPELDGKVVQVIEHGYRRRDRVLRHAKVAVGRFIQNEQTERLQ